MIKNLDKLLETSKKFLAWKYPNKTMMPDSAKFETGYDAKKEMYFVRIDGNTVSVFHRRPQNVIDLALKRLTEHMQTIGYGLRIDSVSTSKKNMDLAILHSDLKKIIDYVDN